MSSPTPAAHVVMSDGERCEFCLNDWPCGGYVDEVLARARRAEAVVEAVEDQIEAPFGLADWDVIDAALEQYRAIHPRIASTQGVD